MRGKKKVTDELRRGRYEFYNVLEMEKAERWKSCQIRAAIKVSRAREELKSGKCVPRCEKSYYLTNEVGALRRIGTSNQTPLASGNE